MNADLTGRLHVPGPSSRYILPQFEERTSYGMKRLDPYTKLFEDRIIFLGVQVDDASADDVIAQLLVLESQDPDRDILMYINSPGGSFTAMTAIYDTMQYIRPDVQTFVIGQAASAAAVLLGAGAKGKRFALPNAASSSTSPPIEGSTARPPTSRSRPTRSCGCANLARGHLASTRAVTSRRSARTSSATRSSPPRRPRSTA
jgi:ATP-dependent Clp protease protease subunit